MKKQSLTLGGIIGNWDFFPDKLVSEARVDILNGLESRVNQKTGLIIDPYFSGTKVIWLYENEPHIRAAIDKGKACFGNVDSWLLYQMTGGSAYGTDYTNASRTLFFNLKDLEWDRSNHLMIALKRHR